MIFASIHSKGLNAERLARIVLKNLGGWVDGWNSNGGAATPGVLVSVANTGLTGARVKRVGQE
jgi:hypothetical protein